MPEAVYQPESRNGDCTGAALSLLVMVLSNLMRGFRCMFKQMKYHALTCGSTVRDTQPFADLAVWIDLLYCAPNEYALMCQQLQLQGSKKISTTCLASGPSHVAIL